MTADTLTAAVLPKPPSMHQLIVAATIDNEFTTETPASEGSPIITPYFTVIEHSILISRREPPTPGVIDLTAVGDDVVFDNVVFKDCRLEGWFRPEWFRNSSFEGCVLPESLSKQQLVNAGNTVD